MPRCPGCLYHEEIDGDSYCVYKRFADNSTEKVKMYEHIALRDSPCDRFRVR